MAIKRYCDFDRKETTWKEEQGETPQGYPQEIQVCGGCGVRVLMNDPEADFIAAGGVIDTEENQEENE